MTTPRLDLHLATGPDHVVRCWNEGRWHPRAFDLATEARAEFDRLRRLYPLPPLQLLIGDRVIETSGAAAPQARAA
jgi:hypothetical protein